MNAPKWREFLEASSLAPSTVREFGERARAFVPMDPPPEPFAQAGAEVPLGALRGSLRRLFTKRVSAREFTDAGLNTKDLSVIFSAFSAVDRRRTYPSAGALYPVHAFGLLLRVSDPWRTGAVRYDHRTNGLGYTAEWSVIDAVERVCSLAEDTHPQMVVVFVSDGAELERKYDERAGRFALLEAGHMAQNLALCLGKAGLVGYELGGLQDGMVKELLGLGATDAQILHGYACGK